MTEFLHSDVSWSVIRQNSDTSPTGFASHVPLCLNECGFSIELQALVSWTRDKHERIEGRVKHLELFSSFILRRGLKNKMPTNELTGGN